MVEFEARVLTAPRLIYGPDHHQKATQPVKGVWDMRGKKFHSSVNIEHWAMALFVNQYIVKENDVRQFIQQLVGVSSQAGMSFNPKPVFCKYAVGAEQVEPMFKYLKQTYPGK